MRGRPYRPKHAHRHHFVFTGSNPFGDWFTCRTCGERTFWEADR